MELIIISGVVFIVGFILLKLTDFGGYDIGELLSFLAILLGGLGFIVSTIGYIQSSKTANYINKKYDTNYTANELFWNSDLIMSELKLDDKLIDNSSKLKIELEQK